MTDWRYEAKKISKIKDNIGKSKDKKLLFSIIYKIDFLF